MLALAAIDVRFLFAVDDSRLRAFAKISAKKGSGHDPRIASGPILLGCRENTAKSRKSELALLVALKF